MEKVYHIYAKERCIVPNVSEEEFESVWNTIRNMVGIMKTEYSTDDITYEELELNREVWKEASH